MGISDTDFYCFCFTTKAEPVPSLVEGTKTIVNSRYSIVNSKGHRGSREGEELVINYTGRQFRKLPARWLYWAFSVPGS